MDTIKTQLQWLSLLSKLHTFRLTFIYGGDIRVSSIISFYVKKVRSAGQQKITITRQINGHYHFLIIIMVAIPDNTGKIYVRNCFLTTCATKNSNIHTSFQIKLE